jgi:hypothetical protein
LIEENAMAPRKKKKRGTGGNRLVGWLISYAMDENGFTYEIRSGRSLIGSEDDPTARLLTLEDKSISAPHLALKASAKHKVMIQDIFSEHGSFVIREGSDKEEVISGPTELRHGDWLRVGKNSRFQVCLIDGPGSSR